MKKNLIIGLLTIVSLLSLTYGYIQKQRADEQEALAIENAKIAREQQIIAEQSRKEAEMQRMMAIANEQRAMEQAAMAQKALEDARKKKWILLLQWHHRKLCRKRKWVEKKIEVRRDVTTRGQGLGSADNNDNLKKSKRSDS